MRTITRFVVALAALGSIALIGGCKNTVTIKTLLDDPSQYDKKTVSIVGTVSGSVGVLGLGTYRMDDGTGTLRVVSKEGGAPRDGARVGVEGEFRSAYTLGAETVAVLIEKRRFSE
jgi:hypothetical protein